jgi:hypothetical protein
MELSTGRLPGPVRVLGWVRHCWCVWLGTVSRIGAALRRGWLLRGVVRPVCPWYSSYLSCRSGGLAAIAGGAVCSGVLVPGSSLGGGSGPELGGQAVPSTQGTRVSSMFPAGSSVRVAERAASVAGLGRCSRLLGASIIAWLRRVRRVVIGRKL